MTYLRRYQTPNNREPIDQDTGKPLTNIAQTATLAGKVSGTVDKINESILADSGLEKFAFNYVDEKTGTTLTSNLFERRPQKGGFFKKAIGGSFKNPYERIQVNQQALENFSYDFTDPLTQETIKLTGTDAARQMMTDKGIESDNIDRVLQTSMEEAAIDEVSKVGSRLEKLKEMTEFTDDRSFRILPGMSKSGVTPTNRIYKNGEVVSRVEDVMKKVNESVGVDITKSASSVSSDIAETAGETIMDQGGLSSIATDVSEEAIESVGEEIAEEAVSEVGKEIAKSAASAVGVAKGGKQAAEGAQGIVEGDINYKNASDVVHGVIHMATPALATNPIGQGIILVNTVWDILDG